MTTTVLLIRHGHTDAVGHRLTGRLPGVHLSSTGRAQAERLAVRLRHYSPAAIYTSPLERARDTAYPASRALGIGLYECAGLTEVNFGEWTGRSFAELQEDATWVRYNARREGALVPDGESANDVQRRILSTLVDLAFRHEEQTIAAFTHAELIRAAVLYYMGFSLNRFTDCDIAPGSVTGIAVSPRPKLLFVNDIGEESASRDAAAAAR